MWEGKGRGWTGMTAHEGLFTTKLYDHTEERSPWRKVQRQLAAPTDSRRGTILTKHPVQLGNKLLLRIQVA